MTNIQIRQATEQDIPFLWEMLYESLYVPEGEQPFAREIIEEPFMAKYVQDWGRAGDLGYIAVDDINTQALRRSFISAKIGNWLGDVNWDIF